MQTFRPSRPELEELVRLRREGRARRGHAREQREPAEPPRRDTREDLGAGGRVPVQSLPGPDRARAASADRRCQRARARERAGRQRRRRAHLRPAARVGRARTHAARHAADVLDVRDRRAVDGHGGGARAARRGLLDRRGGGPRARARRRHRRHHHREPEQPDRGARQRVVPDRAARLDRRDRDGRRGLLRVQPPYDAPAHGPAPEPRASPHLLQGVLARRACASATCSATPRWSAS